MDTAQNITKIDEVGVAVRFVDLTKNAENADIIRYVFIFFFVLKNVKVNRLKTTTNINFSK